MMDHNFEELQEAGVDIDGAKNLLRAGRKFYANKIIEDHIQLHRRMENLSTEESVSKGKESAVKALSRAYHKWFGLQVEQARDMLLDILSEADTDVELVEEQDEDPIAI